MVRDAQSSQHSAQRIRSRDSAGDEAFYKINGRGDALQSKDEGLAAQAPGSERQWGASQVQTDTAQGRRHCQRHVAAPPAETHHRHFILCHLRQWCADTLTSLRPTQLTHLMGNKMRSCAGASPKFWCLSAAYDDGIGITGLRRQLLLNVQPCGQNLSKLHCRSVLLLPVHDYKK